MLTLLRRGRTLSSSDESWAGCDIAKGAVYQARAAVQLFLIVDSMDSTTGGILGIFGILVSGAGLVYTAINHKNIKCRCCGKNMDVSIDIDPTDAVVVVKKKAGEKTRPVEETKVEEEEEEDEEDEEDEEAPTPPPPPPRTRRASIPM